MLDEPEHWLGHLRRAARHRGAEVDAVEIPALAYLRGWLAAKAEAVPRHVDDVATDRTARIVPGDRARLPRFLTEQRREQRVRSPVARIVRVAGNKRAAGGGR